jgi:hypothetical protein
MCRLHIRKIHNSRHFQHELITWSNFPSRQQLTKCCLYTAGIRSHKTILDKILAYVAYLELYWHALSVLWFYKHSCQRAVWFCKHVQQSTRCVVLKECENPFTFICTNARCGFYRHIAVTRHYSTSTSFYLNMYKFIKKFTNILQINKWKEEKQLMRLLITGRNNYNRFTNNYKLWLI